MSERRPGSQKKRDRKLRIFFRDGGKCFYCDMKLNINNRITTLDHIIPRSKGGTWADENIVLACRPCNEKRATMDALEFLRLKMGNR